jgi:arylsulfatase A-like enzyme
LANPGSVDEAFMTVMDLAPTFLELAGATIDDQIRGRSLVRRLSTGGQAVYGPEEPVAWEVYGRRAVHMGPWKLLLQEPPFGTGEWELHNLDSDLGEQTDVSGLHPEIFEQLKAHWQAYADEVGVLLPETPVAY